MLDPVLTLIAWWFKKTKKNHSQFTQDKKQQHHQYRIPNAYCLDLQKARKNHAIKRQGLIPNSLIDKTYW
jgi:hypothetical protein